MHTCWAADAVSVGAAFAMAVAIASIVLVSAWRPEPIRALRTHRSALSLVVNGSLGVAGYLLLREAVFAPFSCDVGNLADISKALLGGFLGSLPVISAAPRQPSFETGQMPKVGELVGQFLLYNATLHIESRREQLGQTMLEPLTPLQCLETFPAWLTRQHPQVFGTREARAALNELATFDTNGLGMDAIRAYAGGELLQRLPVRILKADVALFVGSKP